MIYVPRSYELRRFPLVVNSQGWVKGLGLIFLQSLLTLTTPSHLVEISRQSPSAVVQCDDESAHQSAEEEGVESETLKKNSNNRSIFLNAKDMPLGQHERAITIFHMDPLTLRSSSAHSPVDSSSSSSSSSSQNTHKNRNKQKSKSIVKRNKSGNNKFPGITAAQVRLYGLASYFTDPTHIGSVGPNSGTGRAQTIHTVCFC